MTVIGEYIDKALTGRTDKRPDFQRMLRDSEKGVFQVVICWKIDRFARNRYDSAINKFKLKKNGVRLAYAKESIPDGPEGIILESVMEGYAEYYSENLSQNVKRGFYDSALELKTLGQRVLGLRKSPDDHFEIDPATAPLVRRIFEEYAAGTPAKTIFTQLNDEGYHTSTGGSFNKNSMRRIVQNEKYIGIYEYKDIRVENAIPAIVDKDLFDRCGQQMVGDSGTSKNGNTYYYYTCKGHRAHKCSKMRVQQDWIEQLVMDNLLQLIHSNDFINEVADKCMEYQTKEQDNSVLNALEARRKELNKSIKN